MCLLPDRDDRCGWLCLQHVNNTSFLYKKSMADKEKGKRVVPNAQNPVRMQVTAKKCREWSMVGRIDNEKCVFVQNVRKKIAFLP